MKSESQHRQEIAAAGRRIYQRGYISGGDGNISVRLDSGRLLATPSGISKGFMSAEDMVVTDLEGRKISGTREPSSEIKMHVLIYRLRPDAQAVVHAHPPVATGYASAGLALDRPLTAESVLTLGAVPLAAYATPGTPEVSQSLEKLVPRHDAVLMANHGVVAYGNSLEQALCRMETVEHVANIGLVTEILGRKSELDPQSVEKLLAIRQRLLAADPGPAVEDDEAVVQAVADEILNRLGLAAPQGGA
ncbi:MAG: class II aldolase/adducin family protein [Elusimicrobia bacterium]|nr:class II aldolase/adducin family protein [Elusimicrobiota bacterium]